MNSEGLVIWITGLSGSGKTTLSQHVTSQLREQHISAIFLDGDELREVLGGSMSEPNSYGRGARLLLAKRYSLLSRLLSSQGHTVIVATVSLFREVHEWNRQNIPNYFEVYLRVPLDELRRRDPKGIYRDFDDGKLENVAGLDLGIDEPESPDWVVEFDAFRTPESIAQELLTRAREEKK